MSAQSLEGKTVVVIGGTSGIGLAVAQAAQAAGAKVVVGSSQASQVRIALDRLGEAAAGAAVDVTDEADLKRFFEGIGAFDHLVFTAGDWRQGPGPLRDMDLGAAAEAFKVRFWGALASVKHAVPHMAEGGSITLTDGLYAHRPPKGGGGVGSAMLGAVEHLARGLAVDLAPLRVNCVCPGLILTDRNMRMPEEMVKRFTAALPLPRGGDPAEVAEAYLYLMRGGYTTGQVLYVDGGRMLV